jgi:K+-sensing histidine kinase KdpD
MLNKLFTKFTTRDVTETAKNGTGLGLYICKGIVEAHGGTIEGVNAKEGGAVFRFLLPVATHMVLPELEAMGTGHGTS